MSEFCGNLICQQNQECPPIEELLNPVIAAENVCAGGVGQYMRTNLLKNYARTSLAIEEKISTADTGGWPEILDNIARSKERSGPTTVMHGLAMEGSLLLLKARAARQNPTREELYFSYALTEQSLVKGAQVWRSLNSEKLKATDHRRDTLEYQSSIAKRILASILVSYLSLKECISNPDESFLTYPSSFREMGELGVSQSQSHTSHTTEQGGMRRIFNMQLSERSLETSKVGTIDLSALGGTAYSEASGTFVARQNLNKIIKNLPLPGNEPSMRRKIFSDILSKHLQKSIGRIAPRDASRQ